MLRDVQGERRLTDRRAGRDDDEVAWLEARRQGVEVGKARADARDLAAMRVEVVQSVVCVVQERLERAEAGIDALLADREELSFRPVDGLLDLRRIFVTDAGDTAGCADQVPKHGLALHDPRVLRGVDGGRRLVAEAREVRTTAHRLEILAPLERFGDRDDVDRFATFEQVEDGGVDAPVRLTVEVLRSKELGDFDDGIAVDEDGTEHRLLSFKALWRKAVDHDPRDVRDGCDD